jgi:hypothetical protein
MQRGVSATAAARAVLVLDGRGPWSEAPHRAAGKRAARFRAASSAPVIRVVLTRPPAHLCAWHLPSTRIRTRRDGEHSERMSEARFPASRKRASDGQCRRGVAAVARDRDADRPATRRPKTLHLVRPATGHWYNSATYAVISSPRSSLGLRAVSAFVRHARPGELRRDLAEALAEAGRRPALVCGRLTPARPVSRARYARYALAAGEVTKWC